MVWKGIKSIINVKSKNHDSINCIETNNMILTEPRDIANSFNDYFTTIADKIITKQKKRYGGKKHYRDYLSNRVLENFIFASFCILLLKMANLSFNALNSALPFHNFSPNK